MPMQEFMEGGREKLIDAARQKFVPERAKPIGDNIIERKRYREYYDVSNTITTALTTNPFNADDPGYNREPIYQKIGRKSDWISVTNDNSIGGAIIFVIVLHTNTQTQAVEVPVYPKETKGYWNVFEFRLRSAVQGSPYRVTEYEIEMLQ